MGFIITQKIDCLTPEQREQFDRIERDIDESGIVDEIWSSLDHEVTDTIEGSHNEPVNFSNDLAEFIFGWVMGEKMNAIKAKKENINKWINETT